MTPPTPVLAKKKSLPMSSPEELALLRRLGNSVIKKDIKLLKELAKH